MEKATSWHCYDNRKKSELDFLGVDRDLLNTVMKLNKTQKEAFFPSYVNVGYCVVDMERLRVHFTLQLTINISSLP